MEKRRLKACPFCGGEAEIINHTFGTAGAVRCKSCKVLIMFPWHDVETMRDMGTAWNRRAGEHEGGPPEGQRVGRDLCGGCGYYDGYGCERSPVVKPDEEECRCDGKT